MHTHTWSCHIHTHMVMSHAHIASKQLQNVVFKLVKESFGDSYYDKALSCVTALREESIKV